MWKRSGQVKGRSSALERAQAVLSSRRGRAAQADPAALAAPRMSTELLSDLSESSLSSVPGRPPGPQQTGPGAPEVAQHLTPADSGPTRFLKRPPATAQDTSKERAVSSSVRVSQTVALSRLAKIEHRFGKSVHKKNPSRAEQRDVQNLTEEQTMLPTSARPSSAQPGSARPGSARPSALLPGTEPRHFVKSRPQAALASDTVFGRDSDPSEHSTQESKSRQLLYSETSQAPLSRELHHSPVSPHNSSPAQSPSCLSPSPPTLSPSVGSACGDVRSLEELFPLEESDCVHSDTGHFRINLMDLDDLGPAALVLEEPPSGKEPQEEELQETVPEEELQEEVPEEELQEEVPEEKLQEEGVPEEGVPEEEVPEEEVPEEEVQEEIEDVNYPTDFESVDHTESLSEHSQDSGQPPSPRSQSSYSNTFTRATPSDPSSPDATSQPNSPLPQPDTLSAKASKSTAGHTFHLPAVHCDPCPSMGLLMESLRQQLALTSHFINSSQEQHTRVLEGLGPPNYRYTTLEDTLKSISTLRLSKPRSDQRTERR